ncbi:MAG: LPS assembly protein LptD [Pseudomonadales bacterium]|nr:LPS assembly protein LptD [Pseudomonadales bacterium]
MYLKKHAPQQLKLAIIAATLASIHTSANAESSWQCRQIKGQWDCSAANININSSNAISSELFPESLPATINDHSAVTFKKKATIEPPSLQPSDITEPTLPEQSPAPAKSTNALNRQSIATSATEPTRESGTPNISAAATSQPQPTIASSALQEANVSAQDTEVAEKSASQTLQLSGDDNPVIEQTSLDFKNLDWYPYTTDTGNQGACRGRYISPKIGDPDTKTPTNSQQVFISADESATVLGQTSTLKGNVDILQGDRLLHSPMATIDQETGEFSLEDGVTYRKTGLLVTGSRAEGNINGEETRLYDAKYVVHDKNIRGNASVITHKANNTSDILEIEQGSYTLCPPGEESWKVTADNINLDVEKGFGRAENAKLVLFGQPVIYFPVFYFPLDDRRKSGFLYPSFKFTDSDSQVTIPYYFNIAPHMDDTLTAKLTGNETLLLENEFRYLDKYSLNRISMGSVASKNSTKGQRWLLGLNHQGQYGQFNTHIDYTAVSDNEYFADFGSDLDVDDDENNQLNQSAKINYQADTWQSSVLVQRYQTIDDSTKPYQRLPEIRFSGSPAAPYEHISFNHRTVLTRFDRDLDGLTGTDRLTGDRLIFNPSISGEVIKTWGYIKPKLKLWHARYNLNNQVSNASSNPKATVPILEIDSGLIFDRDFSFQDKGYTQTLEPRLYALYVPYVDQKSLPDFDTSELTFTYNSLFRDNRFSGDDRFGDSKRISLGLTSRVISDEGREIVSASVGHAIYLADRKVRIDPNADPIKDDTSDFATSVIWRPNSRVRALFDAAFDADTLDNSEMTLDLKYEADPNHVIGIRHRFTRDTRKQSTLSMLWPIANNWSGLGLMQYDWRTNTAVDAALGLEFESCCWKTRIVYRDEFKEPNRDKTIAVQFILKGLGGVGKSTNKELRDKIKGYQKREYYNAVN